MTDSQSNNLLPGLQGYRVAETVTPRAMRIMDLYIQGLQPKEIAERLGMERTYVAAITKAPNFQHSLAIRRERIEQQQDESMLRADEESAKVLKSHAREAAEKMVSLMSSGGTEGIQLRAAADVLDRVGVSKQRGPNVAQQAVVVIGDDAAKLIQETLQIESGDNANDLK